MSENAAPFGDVFEAEAAAAASSTDLLSASQIVELMARQESYVTRIEAKLEEEKAKLTEMKTRTVVDAMKKVNQAQFTLADGPFAGVTCEIADFVAGSLPKEDSKNKADESWKERRKAAIEWVSTHQGEDIIVTEITVTFRKSQHNEALDLCARLKGEGHDADFSSSIHPQTLQKYARERIKKGEELDAEILGLHVGTTAKLKWPKEAR